MISVAVSDCEVIVSGHAGYAPPGNDIICAAVSALTQSLASSLEALTEAKQIQRLIPVMSGAWTASGGFFFYRHLRN